MISREELVIEDPDSGATLVYAECHHKRYRNNYEDKTKIPIYFRLISNTEQKKWLLASLKFFGSITCIPKLYQINPRKIFLIVFKEKNYKSYRMRSYDSLEALLFQIDLENNLVISAETTFKAIANVGETLSNFPFLLTMKSNNDLLVLNMQTFEVHTVGTFPYWNKAELQNEFRNLCVFHDNPFLNYDTYPIVEFPLVAKHVQAAKNKIKEELEVHTPKVLANMINDYLNMDVKFSSFSGSFFRNDSMITSIKTKSLAKREVNDENLNSISCCSIQ